MNKVIIPAIVIAAAGGYFYYQNMAPATSEEIIAKEIETAVEGAGAPEAAAGEAKVVAANDMLEMEGDVFADVPELMGEGAMETAAVAAEDMVEEAMEDMPEGEVDHPQE